MAYEPTYIDAIESAMGHLKVMEVGEALDGDDLKRGWDGLLSMLAWWTRYKIFLNIPDNPFDVIVDTQAVPEPDPSLKETLASNLAMHLQPFYGTTISQPTVKIASDSIDDLKRIALKTYQAENPVTLEVSRMIGACPYYDINTG